jgi:geranylgeranyl diphosphate synthase type II
LSGSGSKAMPFAWLAQASQMVDAALDALMPSAGAAPQALHTAMRYSVFPGGKRLRPALTVAAWEAVSRLGTAWDVSPDGPDAPAIRAGAAVELVHSYSLIHDDLPCMDDDDLRRGRPSCHRAYGEAVALLAGDALLTLAFESLARPEFAEAVGAHRACLLIGELARAAGSLGMVGGQALELAMSEQSWAGRLCEAAEAVQGMESMKTGCLFEASARMGGIAGGASQSEMAELSQFARQFGLAFQIRDDMEDAEPQDVESGRITAVSVWGLEGARDRFDASIVAARRHADHFGEAGSKLRDLLDLISFA